MLPQHSLKPPFIEVRSRGRRNPHNHLQSFFSTTTASHNGHLKMDRFFLSPPEGMTSFSQHQQTRLKRRNKEPDLRLGKVDQDLERINEESLYEFEVLHGVRCNLAALQFT